jgi:1,2-dihydroxy-3-keto-5-methylthiopentene dioxygenase
MKAYYYDESDPSSQQTPHLTDTVITEEDLSAIGVFYRQLLGPNALTELNDIAREREYKNRDEIEVSPKAMGDIYQSKLKTFFEEHLHEDEEIRFVVDGTGYFDVREDNKDGKWIRIQVEKGDLLVLPAGIYHRFTTDEGDYIRATRLFKEEVRSSSSFEA